MQDRSETDWKVVVMNLEEARKRNIENVNDLNRIHPGRVFVTAASFLNIAAKTGIVNLSEIYYYEILANKHHLNSP